MATRHQSRASINTECATSLVGFSFALAARNRIRKARSLSYKIICRTAIIPSKVSVTFTVFCRFPDSNFKVKAHFCPSLGQTWGPYFFIHVLRFSVQSGQSQTSPEKQLSKCGSVNISCLATAASPPLLSYSLERASSSLLWNFFFFAARSALPFPL